MRWSSEWHKKSLNLLWADGEGFEIEEREELDDEAAAGLVLATIRSNPGTSWSRVEEQTKGIRAERRRQVRDGLLAAHRILNVVKENGAETILDYCPERRPSRLYAADDPTIASCVPPYRDAGRDAVRFPRRIHFRGRPASRSSPAERLATPTPFSAAATSSSSAINAAPWTRSSAPATRSFSTATRRPLITVADYRAYLERCRHDGRTRVR